MLFIPTRPMRPTAAMVSSGSSMVMPSPGWKTLPARLSSRAIRAFSTARPILAAQLALAPSHTMPPRVSMLLVMVSQRI